MIWNAIHHMAMYVERTNDASIDLISLLVGRALARDILVLPRWSFASKKAHAANQSLTMDNIEPKLSVRESLSNILLTHIDFRRPILDSKRYNSSNDDDTIERVPESCIEDFNLYVSTWKGWQGPLPSKDNRITWEQVESSNTQHGTVSCTEVLPEPTEDLDDSFGNATNGSTTTPPVPLSESFRLDERFARCWSHLCRL